jgi:hypothetical protein
VTTSGEDAPVGQRNDTDVSTDTLPPASQTDTGLYRLGRIVDKMQQEVDTLTNAFVGKAFQATSSPSFGLHVPAEVPTPSSHGGPFPSRGATMAKRLPADCFEEKAAYVVKADVPGM